MIQKLFGIVKSKAISFALNRRIECHACHKKVYPQIRRHYTGDIQDVRCPACNDSSPAEVWLSQMGDNANPLPVRPEKCGILHEFSQGAHQWIVPGSRRPNFFWIFALFWNSITWTISGFTIYAILFGTPSADVQENPWLLWFVPIFLLPFIAIGIGVLYAALAFSFQKTTIILDLRELRIIKNLFGWKRAVAHSRNDIEDVIMDVAYEQNNSDIYGLRIIFKKGKALKLSISRPHVEKRWLLHELRQTLRLEHIDSHHNTADSAQRAASSYTAYQSKNLNITPRLDGFTYTSKSSMGPVLTIMGIVFTMISSVICFMIYRDNAPVFPFGVVAPIAGILGIAMFLYGIIQSKTSQHFELLGETIRVRKLRSGKTIGEQNYLRRNFHKAEMRETGHVNHQPRYAVYLTGEQTVKLCAFLAREDAEALQSRALLWLDQR